MTGAVGSSCRPQKRIIRVHCSTESETKQMKDYMNYVSVEDALKAGRTDTICWDCKKYGGGCSWSDPERFQPVKGWTATKTTNGYNVHSCPEFMRGTWGCARYRTAEDYILALEIALTERKTQIARMKKVPDNVRIQNAQLKRTIARLQDQLDHELWQAIVHMSD